MSRKRIKRKKKGKNKGLPTEGGAEGEMLLIDYGTVQKTVGERLQVWYEGLPPEADRDLALAERLMSAAFEAGVIQEMLCVGATKQERARWAEAVRGSLLEGRANFHNWTRARESTGTDAQTEEAPAHKE